MKEDDFFDVQSPSSRIKANIVAEYFPQYAKILLKSDQEEVRYLDLFAGPGIYKDGSHSTPLLIGKACSATEELRSKVRLLFNDRSHSEALKQNFYTHFPQGTFRIEPRFGSLTVGEDDKIRQHLTKPIKASNPTPTLLFFDPWGYKGINTAELCQFLGHWGNELFLFINLKRIRAAVNNPNFEQHMQVLLPTTLAKFQEARKYIPSVTGRMNLLMETLIEEFKTAVKGSLYHCAFKFQEEDSNTTSHFILHFTKHPKGYDLIKQVYYDFDNIGATLEKNGVYSFDAKQMGSSGLDFSDANVAILSQKLLAAFKGKTISAKKAYDLHHPQTMWCGSHYTKTFRHMVEQGLIKAYFSDSVNHKVSVLIQDSCILTFI